MTSDELARDYLVYRDEEANIPASELFGEADAQRAVSLAERLLALYTRLLGETD